jgi:hypothetical protein
VQQHSDGEVSALSKTSKEMSARVEKLAKDIEKISAGSLGAAAKSSLDLEEIKKVTKALLSSCTCPMEPKNPRRVHQLYGVGVCSVERDPGGGRDCSLRQTSLDSGSGSTGSRFRSRSRFRV